MKNLTFKEKIWIFMWSLIVFGINFYAIYFLNQTQKYILVKDFNAFNFIYIDKNIGFLLFVVLYLAICILFYFIFYRLRLNYDHSQTKIWKYIFSIVMFSLCIFNFKRNMIFREQISDHLILMVTIFISYLIYFWSNLTKFYRAIKIPFIFINSENKIYINFQYRYLWIYVYIFFTLIFLSQMIASRDFYFIIVVLLILDILFKNIYLYYKNISTPNSSNLLLIRHGQTDANLNGNIQGWTDNKLNNLGKEQIKDCVQYIKGEFDIYQCSPLIRSYESLEIICDGLNLFPQIQLNEYVIERNFGSLENVWRDPNINNYFENFDGYINSVKIPNFETNKMLSKRCQEFEKYLKKYYKGNNILIVSHSHFIKGFLSYVTKENYFTYKIPNASMSYFEIFENDIVCSKTDVAEYKKQV